MEAHSETGTRPLEASPLGSIRGGGSAAWILSGAVACGGLIAILLLDLTEGIDAALATAAIAAPLLLLVGAIRGEKPRRERADHDLLIVGRNRRTQDYLSYAFGNGRLVNVIGVLDCEKEVDGRNGDLTSCHRTLDDYRIPYLGAHHRLDEVVRRRPVDEVLITLPIKSCYDEIAHCLSICHEAGIPASVSTDLFKIDRPRAEVVEGPAKDFRLLRYRRTHRAWWKSATKRAIDIAGSGLGILVLAIPMIVIAIAVKLTSRGPVLYRQQRSGLNGKTFRFPKFRTMVVNADELRKQIEHLNEQEGPVFKMKNDPRITRVGRFLRKYSLDELPQLFCVLFGRMSLVGPRPPIPAEVEKYEWWQRRRLSVKPGLTCLWQIQGRNDIPFREWMRLDLKYIDEWSLWLDIKLIVLTVPAVVRGSGV